MDVTGGFRTQGNTDQTRFKELTTGTGVRNCLSHLTLELKGFKYVAFYI